MSAVLKEAIRELVSGELPRVRKLALVADSNVDRLHGDVSVRDLESLGLEVDRIVFPAGEPSKTLENYVELVRSFAAYGLTRTDLVIAMGGGVTGDLAGFAAATYMRGIDFVQVPTTLLAMVDSSIGGKTGVDIPEGKNLVGAFRLPRRIVRDLDYLRTLPERELKNGIAEMIKTAILFDAELFAELRDLADGDRWKTDFDTLGRLAMRTAEWKEKVVAEDFREGGRRKLLNLGHTFGHAIESASEFRLSHGESVAVGMRIVGRDLQEIADILDRYGFPTEEDVAELCAYKDELGGVGARRKRFRRAPAPVLSYLANDKKRSGDMITLVLPRKIGECELVDVPMAEAEKWLR